MRAGASRAGFLDLWLLGAVLAGAFGLYLAGTAGIVGRFNDDSFYALAARSLAESGLSGLETMRSDPSRFPVGFSAFLAVLWIAAGRSYSAVPLWEASVGLLSALFSLAAYVLLTRAWAVNRWMAAVSVILVAFHPVTVKYSGAVMSDLPCAALTAGALGLLECARRRQGSGWLPVAAGIAVGLCFVTRYAAVVLAFAAVAAFARERRGRAAAAIAISAIGTALPWVWWVVQHRAFGYAEEYARSAGARSYAGSLIDSGSWLAFESLPGLLLPGPFLPGLDTWDPAPPGASPLAIAGLILGGMLVGGCVREWRAPGRSVPSLFALGTLALVLLWSGRFPKLGWDLQIRLLLPVAPILLGFALDWAWREVARLPGRRRAAFALLAVLTFTWALLADARSAALQIASTREQSRDYLRGLMAARSYLARVPADVRVGTLYAAQASFYIPRRFEAVRPSVAGLREARDRGIRLILATPYFVREADVMRESVATLARIRPPEARVLFAPTDNVAIVHLPAPRPTGP